VRTSTGRRLVLAALDTVREGQVTFLAAAIAYYAFVSIVPLALLGLALGHALGPERFAPLVAGVEQFLTPAAIEIVGESVGGAARGGATALGLAVLAWSGSKVVRGLDVAFARVYGTAERKAVPAKLLDAAVVLSAIPAALLASALLGVLVPALDWLPLAGMTGRLGMLAVLTVAFFPLYYRLPPVQVEPREALPGALVAAVGWGLLATGFSLYAAAVGDFHLYGVLGAALLLVTWLYLGGIIIMVGAVVNIVLAGSAPDERPDGGDGEASERERHDPAPDIGELGREVDRLGEELAAKTVSRSSLEAELKSYVRKRQRAGKATGWGPYLVLLYGTVMTLGAFYWLDGGWAILAMIVVWLSTLGLYVQLVIFGLGLQAASVPGRLVDLVRNFRS
jgi:YihY family inner membrane protein